MAETSFTTPNIVENEDSSQAIVYWESMMMDPFWRRNTMEHIDFMLECNWDAHDWVGIEIRRISPCGVIEPQFKTLIQMKELFLIRSIFLSQAYEENNQLCKEHGGLSREKFSKMFVELFLESTMGNDGRGKATFPYCVFIPIHSFGNEILTLIKFLDLSRSKNSIPFLFKKDPFFQIHGKDFSFSDDVPMMECPVWYSLLRRMKILCHIPGYEKDIEISLKSLPGCIQKYLFRSEKLSLKSPISSKSFYSSMSLFRNQKDDIKRKKQMSKQSEPSMRRVVDSP